MIVDLDTEDDLPSMQELELRIVNPQLLPELKGMRHDGQRWVDEEREDRPFVPVVKPAPPNRDMFGGSGERKPARKIPVQKTRRRGPQA
ncbi:hypothetical protein [Agrobacterium tumefaciens]|uniref:hypothetical protein n=1 Tax=Agrobacterium tumefaciens TaxID=358 RepID=UPI003B9ED51D